MLVLLSLNVIKIKVEELEIGSNGIDWTLTLGDRSSRNANGGLTVEVKSGRVLGDASRVK